MPHISMWYISPDSDCPSTPNCRYDTDFQALCDRCRSCSLFILLLFVAFGASNNHSPSSVSGHIRYHLFKLRALGNVFHAECFVFRSFVTFMESLPRANLVRSICLPLDCENYTLIWNNSIPPVSCCYYCILQHGQLFPLEYFCSGRDELLLQILKQFLLSLYQLLHYKRQVGTIFTWSFLVVLALLHSNYSH